MSNPASPQERPTAPTVDEVGVLQRMLVEEATRWTVEASRVAKRTENQNPDLVSAFMQRARLADWLSAQLPGLLAANEERAALRLVATEAATLFRWDFPDTPRPGFVKLFNALKSLKAIDAARTQPGASPSASAPTTPGRTP